MGDKPQTGAVAHFTVHADGRVTQNLPMLNYKRDEAWRAWAHKNKAYAHWDDSLNPEWPHGAFNAGFAAAVEIMEVKDDSSSDHRVAQLD